MLNFIVFLLVLFLVIIFIGFSILGHILRMFFGVGKRTPNYQSDESHATGNSSQESTRQQETGGSKRKIFGNDEGEYVDFEEVK